MRLKFKRRRGSVLNIATYNYSTTFEFKYIEGGSEGGWEGVVGSEGAGEGMMGSKGNTFHSSTDSGRILRIPEDSGRNQQESN